MTLKEVEAVLTHEDPDDIYSAYVMQYKDRYFLERFSIVKNENMKGKVSVDSTITCHVKKTGNPMSR